MTDGSCWITFTQSATDGRSGDQGSEVETRVYDGNRLISANVEGGFTSSSLSTNMINEADSSATSVTELMVWRSNGPTVCQILPSAFDTKCSFPDGALVASVLDLVE